jgi:hypothetical protein
VRAQQTAGELTVRVTAGNNVVLLGCDLAPPQVAGLLGLGIQRTEGHRLGDHTIVCNRGATSSQAYANEIRASHHLP